MLLVLSYFKRENSFSATQRTNYKSKRKIANILSEESMNTKCNKKIGFLLLLIDRKVAQKLPGNQGSFILVYDISHNPVIRIWLPTWRKIVTNLLCHIKTCKSYKTTSNLSRILKVSSQGYPFT